MVAAGMPACWRSSSCVVGLGEEAARPSPDRWRRGRCPGPITRLRSRRALSRAPCAGSRRAIAGPAACRRPARTRRRRGRRRRRRATAGPWPRAAASRAGRSAASPADRRAPRLGRASWTRSEEPVQRPARRRRAPSARRTGPRRMPPATVSASGIGERSGMPASGSAGRTGTGTTPARDDGDLGRLDDQRAVAAGAAAGAEARGELLHRRLGVEGDQRVLERVRPERPRRRSGRRAGAGRRR